LALELQRANTGLGPRCQYLGRQWRLVAISSHGAIRSYREPL